MAEPLVPDGLAEVAETLYGLPLGDFVAERAARTKAARADGHKALARAVAKLAKPSTSAWVVNMLVRSAPDEIDQLLDLGASLRQAQHDLDGAELRELSGQRQALVTAVVEEARQIAADLGHSVSGTTLTEVEQTVRAAMADEDATAALRSRQLTRPIAASGLGSLGIADVIAAPVDIGRAAARAAGKTTAKKTANKTAKETANKTAKETANKTANNEAEAEVAAAAAAAAEAATAAAKREVERATAAQGEAELAEATASDAVTAAEAALDELEAKIAELRATLHAREDELAGLAPGVDEARATLDSAADTTADARRAVAAATAVLEQLDG